MSPMFTDQFGPVTCHDDVRYALWNHLDGERKGDYDQRDGAELRILATDAALRLALETATRERDIHLKDAAAVREERDGARRWSQHYLAQINETEARAIAAERGRGETRDAIRGLLGPSESYRRALDHEHFYERQGHNEMCDDVSHKEGEHLLEAIGKLFVSIRPPRTDAAVRGEGKEKANG